MLKHTLLTHRPFHTTVGRHIAAAPQGRHLAPARPPAGQLAPLTEIAMAVANGHSQRRAAVVATAGGLLMSSFMAANLDLTSLSDDDGAAAYPGADPGLTTGVVVEYPASYPAGTGADAEVGAPVEPTDADAEADFIHRALPGWVVEAGAAAPEPVTYYGLATVAATPAPPPPPAVRPRGAAAQARPASVAGNAVLEVAARYIGTPYVWGGSTPGGFDCSGFTKYVFAQLGISLPRTSAAQRGAGTVISRDQAQPGDLVWWPGHVGIFAEGNTFIDAAGPGRTVQFRNMWHSNPTFIRL